MNNGPFTKIPEKVIRYLMSTRLPGREMNVLFTIIRYTYGKNRDSAMFQVGQIARCVGIDPPSASRALRRLLNRNIVSYQENGMLTVNDPEVWQLRESVKPRVEYKKVVVSDNLPCVDISREMVWEFWGPDTSPRLIIGGDGLSDTTTSGSINNELYKYKGSEYKVTKDEYAEALAKVLIVYYKEKFHKKYGAGRPVPLSDREGAAAFDEIVRSVKICPETYGYCFFVTLINRNIEEGKVFLPAILDSRSTMEHYEVWTKVKSRKKNCPPGGCLIRTQGKYGVRRLDAAKVTPVKTVVSNGSKRLL